MATYNQTQRHAGQWVLNKQTKQYELVSKPQESPPIKVNNPASYKQSPIKVNNPISYEQPIQAKQYYMPQQKSTLNDLKSELEVISDKTKETEEWKSSMKKNLKEKLPKYTGEILKDSDIYMKNKDTIAEKSQKLKDLQPQLSHKIELQKHEILLLKLKKQSLESDRENQMVESQLQYNKLNSNLKDLKQQCEMLDNATCEKNQSLSVSNICSTDRELERKQLLEHQKALDSQQNQQSQDQKKIDLEFKILKSQIKNTQKQIENTRFHLKSQELSFQQEKDFNQNSKKQAPVSGKVDKTLIVLIIMTMILIVPQVMDVAQKLIDSTI